MAFLSRPERSVSKKPVEPIARELGNQWHRALVMAGGNLRVGLVLLFLVHEQERYERLLAACSGDVAQAQRVYGETLRAAGWRA